MFGETWASEAKRERLRREGIVPYSSAAAFLLLLLVISGIFYFWRSELKEIFKLIKGDGQADSVKELAEILLPLGEFLFWLAFVCLAVVIIAGILQTRFSFRPQILYFKIQWKWPFKPTYLAKSFFINFLLILAAAAIGYLLFANYFAKLVSLLELRREEIVVKLSQFLSSYAFVSAAVVFLLFLLMIGLSRLLFALKHMMTREEIDAENRGR